MTNVKSPAHPPFSITVFHNNYRETFWWYLWWTSDQAQEKEGGWVKLEWWHASKTNIRKRQELGIQAHQAPVTAPSRQGLPGIPWGGPGVLCLSPSQSTSSRWPLVLTAPPSLHPTHSFPLSLGTQTCLLWIWKPRFVFLGTLPRIRGKFNINVK